MSKVNWDQVLEFVLSGRLAIEGEADIPSWPPEGAGSAEGSAEVWMHRDVPGAVMVTAEVDRRFVLCAAYEPRLRSFLALNHARSFRFDSHRGPEGSCKFLVERVAFAVKSETLDPDIRLVCGIEAAQLLSELKRVALERVAAESGSVN